MPSIISFSDNTQDLSIFLDMNEEEEKTGKEATKNLEIRLQTTDDSVTFLLKGIQKKKNIVFKSKKYTSQYFKIDTRPPKLRF